MQTHIVEKLPNANAADISASVNSKQTIRNVTAMGEMRNKLHFHSINNHSEECKNGRMETFKIQAQQSHRQTMSLYRTSQYTSSYTHKDKWVMSILVGKL